MDNTIYLLEISGTIVSTKHKEFEQTIRFVFNLLPITCVSSHLSIDVFNTDVYHLFTVWRTGTDRSKFKQSSEFQMIKGAFDALGFVDHSYGKLRARVLGFKSDDL